MPQRKRRKNRVDDGSFRRLKKSFGATKEVRAARAVASPPRSLPHNPLAPFRRVSTENTSPAAQLWFRALSARATRGGRTGLLYEIIEYGPSVLYDPPLYPRAPFASMAAALARRRFALVISYRSTGVGSYREDATPSFEVALGPYRIAQHAESAAQYIEGVSTGPGAAHSVILSSYQNVLMKNTSMGSSPPSSRSYVDENKNKNKF